MSNPLHNNFIKYLNDECDEADIKALLLHFQLEHEETLLKSLILSALENEQQSFIPQDTDERLSNIFSRVQQHKHQPHTPARIPLRRIVLRVAAAAAVLALGVTAYYWLAPEKGGKAPSVTAATDIAPGRNQAILTTSDGSTIHLSDAATGTLATEQGMRIEKTENGQIVYTGGSKQTKGVAPAQNTIQTPAGGQWQVVLPDQTRVWLNASSSLTYPVAFSHNERQVTLSGEAYFEVSPNKSAPFKVVSGNQELVVLGTSFNIMAYPNDKEVTTTLLSGSVKVAANQQAKTLTPGQQSLLLNHQLQVVNGVDTAQVVAWKNGYFKFNGNIEEIMKQVARWYDVEVVYNSMPDRDVRFQGEVLRSRNLQEVLHIMEYTGKVHFTLDKRKITVTR